MSARKATRRPKAQPTVLERIEEINNEEIGNLCDAFRCLAELLSNAGQEVRPCDVSLIVTVLQAELQRAKNRIEALVC